MLLVDCISYAFPVILAVLIVLPVTYIINHFSLNNLQRMSQEESKKEFDPTEAPAQSEQATESGNEDESVSKRDSPRPDHDEPGREVQDVEDLKFDMFQEQYLYEEYGLYFNNGKLVDVNGHGFIFDVCATQRENQERYETIGQIVEGYVYELLKKRLKEVPVNKPGKGTNIYVSEGYETKENLLVLIHGSGVVRAGQWARRLIINDCLDSGTQLPYIDRALEAGWGVIVMNTNDNSQHEGSRSPSEHGRYVWKHFVTGKKNSRIAIVAHSAGGGVTTAILDKYLDDFKKRVYAIAYTDAFGNPSRDAEEYFEGVTTNWVTSQEPVGTMLYRSSYNTMPMRSAGTIKHEETSHFAIDQIFEYINQRFAYTFPMQGVKARRKSHKTDKKDNKNRKSSDSGTKDEKRSKKEGGKHSETQAWQEESHTGAKEQGAARQHETATSADTSQNDDMDDTQTQDEHNTPSTSGDKSASSQSNTRPGHAQRVGTDVPAQEAAAESADGDMESTPDHGKPHCDAVGASSSGCQGDAARNGAEEESNAAGGERPAAARGGQPDSHQTRSANNADNSEIFTSKTCNKVNQVQASNEAQPGGDDIPGVHQPKMAVQCTEDNSERREEEDMETDGDTATTPGEPMEADAREGA